MAVVVFLVEHTIIPTTMMTAEMIAGSVHCNEVVHDDHRDDDEKGGKSHDAVACSVQYWCVLAFVDRWIVETT